MLRPKQKSLLTILFQTQVTSVVYIVFVFISYFIFFELASISMLIEVLKYLWPAMVFGGVLIFVNLLRAFAIYKKYKSKGRA